MRHIKTPWTAAGLRVRSRESMILRVDVQRHWLHSSTKKCEAGVLSWAVGVNRLAILDCVAVLNAKPCGSGQGGLFLTLLRVVSHFQPCRGASQARLSCRVAQAVGSQGDIAAPELVLGGVYRAKKLPPATGFTSAALARPMCRACAAKDRESGGRKVLP